MLRHCLDSIGSRSDLGQRWDLAVPETGKLPVLWYAARLYGEVAERSKAHAWKACIRQRIEGSNPSLTAMKLYRSMIYD